MKHSLAAFLILCSSSLAAVEFENMSISLYADTLAKGFKAYREGNHERAFALLSLTARWGEKDAQRLLGAMYLAGEGTKVDLVEGTAWLMLAAESGRKIDRDTFKRAREAVPEQVLDAADQIYAEYLPVYGKSATGISCKRARRGDRGRKEVVCERPRGINDQRFKVPVVDAAFYYAIGD
ncbi:MAG: hypothetical protein QNJ40_12985 [Xanthomonadales bacterium]|nr:hypothetical protein [Xanthomonadales bacterium]